MAGRRTYTDSEKTEALKLYETDGPTAVLRKLGIPKGTLGRWVKKAGARTDRNERTREATEAASLDARARRQRIVETQMDITELLQQQVQAVRSGEWKSVMRGEMGAEHVQALDHVPARDAKDIMSAINSASTVIARLDDQTGDHDTATSVIGDLMAGLRKERDRRAP